MASKADFRILVIDDNPDIHRDFIKILTKSAKSEFNKLNKELFGQAEENFLLPTFEIDTASQGEEGVQLVKNSLKQGRPYSLAFVDIRMPPGMDGIETIKQIWQFDKDIQVVINTAFSDYSWEAMISQLQDSENFLILKKPFDIIEVRQLASSLTKKWMLKRESRRQIQNLKNLINERTDDLEKSTSVTKATMESTKDAIFVVDKKKKISLYSKQFLKLWDIQAEIEDKNADTIFKLIANQMNDSDLFLKKITEIMQHPQSENISEWKLKTGKILELHAYPQYLYTSVVGNILSFRDITEQKTLAEKVLKQTTHDDVTGLLNRAFFTEKIQQNLIKFKNNEMNLGILYFGFYQFDQINDALGHKVGDLFLKEVAVRLDNVCETFAIATIRAAEFAVAVTSKQDESYFMSLAKKFLQRIAELVVIERHPIKMSARAGISVFPKQGEDANVLLKSAAAALHDAREREQSICQIASDDINKRILRQVKLENSLKNAIEKKEFLMYYQPIMELQADKIIGVNSIFYWGSRRQGLVPPSEFLPLVEDVGLIIPIGNWFLRKVCEQVTSWFKRDVPVLRVALNIPAQQFWNDDFVDFTERTLNEFHFDSNFLEMELTEDALLKNQSDVLRKMAELKNMGVHLVLDDFRIGYTSLNYLKQFPFEKVRVDYSYIDTKDKSADDIAIIDAFFALTKSLNLQVVIKCTETYGQLSTLRQYADQVHEYIYHKPLEERVCMRMLLEKMNLQS